MAPTSAELHRASGATRLLWLFRLVFSCALAVSAVVWAFLVVGVLDGSVSSFNLGIWLVLLAVVTIIPVMGWRLRMRGRLGWAIAVLLILAFPGLLYGFFLLLVMGSGASWN